MGSNDDAQSEETLLSAGHTAHMRPTDSARTLKVPTTEADMQAEVEPSFQGSSQCRSQFLHSFCLILLVLVWWVSAIFVVLTIKVTVGTRDAVDDGTAFPFPFALTAMTNALTGLLSLICSLAMQSHGSEAPLPKMRWDETLILFTIGLIQGVEIGCNNKVLEFLAVSERTMLNSMNVLAMMCTALCWRLERLGILRAVAVICLTGGGILQGFGHDPKHGGSGGGLSGFMQPTHLKGVLILLSAMVIGAQRWALMQFVMQRSESTSALGQMSKLRFMSFIMPVTGGVCFVLACWLESDALDPERILRPELGLSMLKIAVGVLALCFAELKLVHLTSAVAVNVLSTIHQIPIVLAGVFFFHEHINTFGLSGFGLCLAGALFYVAARRSDVHVEAPPPPMDDDGLDEEDVELMLVGPELVGVANGRSGGSPSAEEQRVCPAQAEEDEEVAAIVTEHEQSTL